MSIQAVLGADFSTLLKEHPNHLLVSSLCSGIQRIAEIATLRVDVGAILEE